MNLATPTLASVFKQAGLVVFERGWLSSNNVLFTGGGQESVLIDSGYCAHAAQTVSLVRQALNGARLDRIVNTHLHSDHCGGNHELQFAYRCSIDVAETAAAMVDAWDEQRLSYAATGQRCPRFKRSGVVRNDADLILIGKPWRVIGSPGHDADSFVLHQPELEILISADALWENGFGVVFPELDGSKGFADVAATLDRIAGLKVKWIIPGHGPAFSGLTAALDRARRRLDAFIAQPARHARYAAKVLIKFHMMDLQRQSATALRSWIAATVYFRGVHEGFFGSQAFSDWSEQLIAELCGGGALRADGQNVWNA